MISNLERSAGGKLMFSAGVLRISYRPLDQNTFQVRVKSAKSLYDQYSTIHNIKTRISRDNSFLYSVTLRSRGTGPDILNSEENNIYEHA